MLLNYLKLSLRLMARNPFFTIINVAGLSIGFATFFVLWQYSQKELTSDRFIRDHDRIFRLCLLAKTADDKKNWIEKLVAASPIAAETEIAKYEKIEDKTWYLPQNLFSEEYISDHGAKILFTAGPKVDRSFEELSVIYARPNFFEFFSIPFSKGDRSKALANTDGIVISTRAATKYFGSEDPIGKTLLLNNKVALMVTGVFDEIPVNSHLRFDIALSYQRIETGLERLYQKGRSRYHPYGYYKFEAATDIKHLEERLNTKSRAAIREIVYPNTSFADAELRFQKLTDIAFESLVADNHVQRSRYFLTTLQAGALIILAMAWINTINLTFSLNRKRIGEIQLRRTVGARHRNLINQFLTESIVINILSLFAAFTIIQLAKFPINQYLNFYVTPWSDLHYSTILISSVALMGGVLFTALFPTVILLQKSRATKEVIRSRWNLTMYLNTGQFTAAVVFVIWVFAINSQINFVLNRNFGLDKRQVMLVDLPFIHTANFAQEVRVFSDRLLALAGVEDVATCFSLSPDLAQGRAQLRTEGGSPWVSLDCNSIDEKFIPFFKIQLLAGRNFRPDAPSDRQSIILSRSAADRLGFESPEAAVGRIVSQAAGLDFPASGVEVVGVFEDYDLRAKLSSHSNRLAGVVLIYKSFLGTRFQPREAAVRIGSASWGETLTGIENSFNEIFPGQIFGWRPLGDQIQSQYSLQTTTRNQLIFFTIIAIIIACLGLLGVITHKAIEKMKEIGVRKVMGAGVHHITQVLLNSTSMQVAIAILLGIPIAIKLTSSYLDTFSERVELTWWHYITPIIILILILLTTIASVLLKAAKSNPVDALKYE